LDVGYLDQMPNKPLKRFREVIWGGDNFLILFFIFYLSALAAKCAKGRRENEELF